MRVLISGAAGLLGSALTRELRAGGHEPVALVRRAAGADEVQWDPARPLDPSQLTGSDAVVHLAGKNIAGLWTKKFKQEVLESRVHGAQTLATAAAESYRQTGKPRVFVCASGMSYYGDRGDEVLTEDSSAGTGFLADVVREWEAAAAPARDAGLRVVSLRIGVVLARNGGALKPMLLPFRLGLGGRVGSGKQYWSWIAVDDVIGVMIFALQNESLQGPVNVVGPAPVRNDEFVRALGRQLDRPTIFPLPEFVVRTLMGQMGEELLLTSARVLPTKLSAAGYTFRYAELPDALAAALK
jgi:uncharacterized protein (TIGR01777 family)